MKGVFKMNKICTIIAKVSLIVVFAFVLVFACMNIGKKSVDTSPYNYGWVQTQYNHIQAFSRLEKAKTDELQSFVSSLPSDKSMWTARQQAEYNHLKIDAELTSKLLQESIIEYNAKVVSMDTNGYDYPLPTQISESDL